MNGNGIVRRIRLGDDVQAYCGRCKEERLHQIVALNNEGRIERVICRTCNSNHLYRDREASLNKRAVRSLSKQSDQRSTTSEKWRSYSPQDVYSEGELISHPKFGMGRVVVSRPGKVDVKFGVEMRTLLQDG